MSTHKMKSLLKGLRYISQIFENEKEPEMQIGNPTDVKHVAHIGWDGGSVNSPSWMTDFKSPAGFSSAPLGDIKEDSSWVSEDSNRRGTRDLPGLPKSSRNRSSASGSPTKEKSRRRSSNPDGSNRSSRRSKESSTQRDENLPEGSKKSRRKKSKDSVHGGSSRSSRRAHRSETENESMSETGSMISISHDIDERVLP